MYRNTGATDHTSSSFKMSIAGTFNESINNESFGVNDIALYIKIICDVSC